MEKSNRLDYLLEISKNSFLQPNINADGMWVVVNSCGEDEYLFDYPENDFDFQDIKRVSGFFAYVSANGYLDYVDIGLFETENDAIEALISYYEGE